MTCAPQAGSVGDSYDKALAETVIGLYKTEVIRQRGPSRNIEQVELATLGWVDWFNNRHLLDPIGHDPPEVGHHPFFSKNSASQSSSVSASRASLSR